MPIDNSMKNKSLSVGSKFNMLTIVKFHGILKNRKHYLVRCDCGVEKVLAGNYLTRKNPTISCGCYKKSSKTDSIEGNKYGSLIALSKVRNSRWLFICDCGVVKEIDAYHVISGVTVSCGCYNKLKSTGKNNKHWRGGISYDSEGYLKERVSPGKYKLQHRLVMEKKLGRTLRDNETVHHINGIKDDNRIENLELWVSSHPRGQRVNDLVDWAKEILSLYPDPL